MTMIVSVALCTYNGSQYIREQMDSILSQSTLPDEIIICDDQSTDTTIAILEEYQKRLQKPAIKIFINEQRLNVTKNFQKAISLCSGKYIFLCDQDDIWMPHKVQRLTQYLDSHTHLDVVFTDAQLTGLQDGTLWGMFNFDQKKRDVWENKGALFALMRYKNICTGASMAIRKAAIAYLFPILENPYHIHDGMIAMVAAVRKKIDFVNECLFFYRIHSNQWTTKNAKGPRKGRVDIDYKCEYMTYFIETLNITDPKIIGLRDHYLARQKMPKNRFARIPKIVNEAISGRYSYYSNGIKSMIGDFVFKIK